MCESLHDSPDNTNPAPRSRDVFHAVLPPIVGSAITGVDGTIVIRRPVLPGESAWKAPKTPSRRLTDLPEPESFIAPGLQGLYASLAAAPPAELPTKLVPYVRYASPNTPADASLFNIAQIVVKFVEGSAIALKGVEVVVSRELEQAANAERLRRAGVEAATVRSEVSKFNALVAASGAAVGRAVPAVIPEWLTLLHRRAERASGNEMPNPNLFYFVHSQRTTPEAAAGLLAGLRALAIVEACYFQPIPFDAVDIAPTTTIDVTAQEGYFRPTPAGIDVDIARRFAGGRGEGVRIVDIEGGWHVDHEDLPAMSFAYGINLGVFDGAHGTAVLGELVAQENGFGANGLVPASAIGWSSFTNVDLLMPWRTYFYSVANALLSAGAFLRPGDIALIEQHYPTGIGPCPNSCNCSQFGYVAVETMPYEHAAITLMTSAGVIVVEAAGNGQMMVTPASTLDSGAIVVGASNNDLTPACFTNFGPRVNVHAWGSGIGTLGFATMFTPRLDAAGNPVLDASGNMVFDEVPDPTLRANGADSRQFYTRSFGGTSGASPIVVGAAALVQSTRTARGLDKLTPFQMRALLVATGTPQAAATTSTAIGPLPNLAGAIATYIPDAATFARETAAPTALTTGSVFSQTVTFRNSGGIPWVGYRMAITQGANGSYPWGNISFPLGSAAAPVMPGDEVTCVFLIHAPAQAGVYMLAYRLTSAAGVDLAFSPRQSIAITATSGGAFDNATATITLAPGSVKVNAAATVIVTVTNTGSTTWSGPNYGLTLTRTGRIVLPQASAPINGTVAPGQSRAVTFTIQGAATPGYGGFSAQMAGPGGVFGTSAGMAVICQP